VITSNQNIILDMIDSSVRILTEKGDIVDCPTKTFMANIHDIRYSVLENKAHQLSDDEKSEGNKVIQNLIGLVQKGSEMTKVEYDALITKIEMVGEDIIRRKLLQMASSNINITDYSNVDAEIERIQKEIDRLQKLKAGR
jgi:hypothetical protein